MLVAWRIWCEWTFVDALWK